MLCFSLEAPWQDISNEYPQHMFSWRNKKNIFLIPPLIWSYDFRLNRNAVIEVYMYVHKLDNKMSSLIFSEMFFLECHLPLLLPTL